MGKARITPERGDQSGRKSRCARRSKAVPRLCDCGPSCIARARTRADGCKAGCTADPLACGVAARSRHGVPEVGQDRRRREVISIRTGPGRLTTRWCGLAPDSPALSVDRRQGLAALSTAITRRLVYTEARMRRSRGYCSMASRGRGRLPPNYGRAVGRAGVLTAAVNKHAGERRPRHRSHGRRLSAAKCRPSWRCGAASDREQEEKKRDVRCSNTMPGSGVPTGGVIADTRPRSPRPTPTGAARSACEPLDQERQKRHLDRGDYKRSPGWCRKSRMPSASRNDQTRRSCRWSDVRDESAEDIRPGDRARAPQVDPAIHAWKACSSSPSGEPHSLK